MLNWANQFSILIFLDSNNYSGLASRYECLMACGGGQGATATTLTQVQQLHAAQQDWLFGHIAYDYKNELEAGLRSVHEGYIGFEGCYFWVPEVVCYMNKEQSQLSVETTGDAAATMTAILGNSDTQPNEQLPSVAFENKTDKETYVATVERLRAHIAAGDFYEINYCTQAQANDVELNPLAVFNKLNRLSPAPFAAYYKNNGRYLICASPERYLCKNGVRVYAQPIKGTAKRGATAEADELAAARLQNDPKERAENVMITDLMRNDLARCCKTGSINVDELCGVYAYPGVHQMISTVSGELEADKDIVDAIGCSYPMGSMTGAPKYIVMEHIDLYENYRRELFSGTVGYIDPKGDGDFNVVIRSLHYNQKLKRLCYMTGGAITYDSVPEQEWEELQLKGWAVRKIFE